MVRFDYAEPATLDEAVALLGAGAGRAVVFAGGTDLLVQMREHVRTPAQVVNIKKILGLDALAFDPVDGLTIGALTTTRAIETSELVRRHYAGLHASTVHFASIQVRHRATVVGNVCRASPSADTLPPLIADGARAARAGAPAACARSRSRTSAPRPAAPCCGPTSWSRASPCRRRCRTPARST